jgi:hypothetical protein
MPISGLLITLESPESQAPVLAALSADPRITVGPPCGLHLPLVTDTQGAEEGETLARELGSLAGVRFMDVVTIDFLDGEH